MEMKDNGVERRAQGTKMSKRRSPHGSSDLLMAIVIAKVSRGLCKALHQQNLSVVVESV